MNRVDYKIMNFKSIIEEYAGSKYDTASAAHLARADAFNNAGRWTDGPYTVPQECEFYAAIHGLRESNGQES